MRCRSRTGSKHRLALLAGCRFTRRMRRSIKVSIVAVIAAGIAAWSCPASAEEANSLYQAMEIVTGTDLRERPRGFAECLQDVLVKVSGDPRLRSDPRVIALAQHAGDYVTTFNYVDPIAGTRPKDDQGTYDRSENLTVTFDPVKIDALIASLGDQPWHGPRPVLVPVLSVHGRKPPAYLMSTTEPLAGEQRAAFERIAAEAAIPLRLPTASDFSRFRVRNNTVAFSPPCGPAGTIVVLGRMDWSDAAPGWIGTWHTCWHNRQQVWSSHGGGYDQAFANIVQGAILLASGHGTPDMLQANRH